LISKLTGDNQQRVLDRHLNTEKDIFLNAHDGGGSATRGLRTRLYLKCTSRSR